jgi:diguanylate cyclase (GGDEF)-like protein
MVMFFQHILKIVQTLFIIITVFLIISFKPANAETPSYNLEQDEQVVVNYLYQLLDEAKPKTINEISNLTANEWQEIYLSNGDLLIMPGENWFVFKLVNKSKEVKQVYLDMANQVRMNDIELFAHYEHNNIEKKVMTLQRSNNRSVDITIAPHSQVIMYLTITSSTHLRSSVKIYSIDKYIEASNILQFQQGIVIGGLFCLSIAFMLLFFATAHKAIVVLFGYFLSNTLMLSAMLGFNLHYFFPSFSGLVGVELPFLSAISAILLLAFTIQLFNLKNKFNNIYKIIKFSVWVLILYVPMSIQLSVADNVSISMAIYVLVEFSLIILGIYLYKHNLRLALLFSFVMMIQLIFVSIVIFSVNWFDMGFVSHRSIFYGVLFWLSCLLVIFILSRQYRYQLIDKQSAQREALISARTTEKTQKELLKLQFQSQEELENRVQERTLELNIALQELEEVNQELEQKNTLDELTGLFNRRFYDQKIIAEYRRSKRNLTPLSLIIIDIDHFKEVNDTHGHLAGDYCIKWLSEHIQQNLKRSSDMAFRYGGEEFCLILPDTDAKGAVGFSESLRKSIEKQACLYKETSIPLTISCGTFTYVQQDDVMPEQIFSGADKALYQAKHNGRNQTQECKDQ